MSTTTLQFLDINSIQAHFDRMYGARIRCQGETFSDSANYFSHRLGQISRSYLTKDGKLPVRLARAMSYFMSMINHFGHRHLDLALGVMEKFPSFGCRYCGLMPCGCGSNRPEPTIFTPDHAQSTWRISRWQEHFKAVYGHRNMGKFEKAYMRLSGEAGELGIIVGHGPNTPLKVEEMLIRCRREAADVFNWLLTLAYIENIDIETEIIKEYSVCPGCGFEICDCDLVAITGSEFSTTKTN